MPQGLKWAGAAPATCDMCSMDIKDGHFVDGKTVMGPWATMCARCHGSYGVGLGVGLGQEYRQLEQVAGGGRCSVSGFTKPKAVPGGSNAAEG